MTARQPPSSRPAAPARPDKPFVGLRPYEERDAVLFFGREDQVNVLVDKIIGSPVTVLFAPSGTGKTSLLRTLVLKGLRELEVRVVYVDSWIDDPVTVVRRAVAGELGGETAGRGEATLLQLSRALHRKTGQGLVLALDQFEQFFLRHADRAGALARELGTLARLGPDAHVVLTLREEFLGRLEALKEGLLTVSQAQHRLAPLSEEEARGAIRGPLDLFEAKIDPALLEVLPGDLRSEGEAAGRVDEAGRSEGVSLPFLQIVCSRLWEASADAPGHEVTKPLYDRLGGKKGIVEDFVNGVTRSLDPRERRDMARILNFLAPKAEVKVTLPVDVLAVQAGVAEDRVTRLLQHLEAKRIVRSRENRMVELFHDAFTDVLRGFIEEELAAEAHEEANRKRELERQAQKARQLRALVAGLVAVLAIVGLLARGYFLEARRAEEKAAEATQQRRIAEEESKRAGVQEAEARELAKIVIAETKKTERELTLIREAIDLRQKFAGGNRLDVRTLAREPKDGDPVFDAGYQPAGSQFLFEIFPRRDQPPERLKDVVIITYWIDHKTFQNSYYMTGPDRRFTASYEGWGYIRNVYALVEYADPRRKPDIFHIDMIEALQPNKPIPNH